MFSWLTANLGTILIVLVLTLIVVGIIVKLRKDKKKGVSSCGGNCAHCALHGTCHPK
jgi:hypothetical protein